MSPSSARPVGPMTKTSLSARSPKPSAITVSLVICGPSLSIASSRRSTAASLPVCFTEGNLPAPICEMNRVAVSPRSTSATLPHGPSIWPPAKVLRNLPLGVEDEQTAGARRRERAVRRGQAADDHIAGLQQRHGGRQADAAGAGGEMLRHGGEQRGRFGCRIVIDDRRASALKVLLVVEIVDEHIALLDLADRDRRDDHGIGIGIAVRRNGRVENGELLYRIEKVRRLRLCRRAENHRGERRCQGERRKRNGAVLYESVHVYTMGY